MDFQSFTTNNYTEKGDREEEVIYKNTIFFSSVGLFLLLLILITAFDECIRYFKKRRNITVVDEV